VEDYIVIEQVWSWLVLQITTNEIFAGLVGLSAMGSVMYLVRGIPRILLNLTLQQFTVELVVHNTDPTFLWIELWLSRQPYAHQSRRLQLAGGAGNVQDISDDWVMGLGTGRHLLFYNHIPMIVLHTTADAEARSGFMKETYEIRVPGRSQRVVKDLIREARALATNEDQTKVYSWCGYWSKTTEFKARPLSSVIAPTGQVEKVIEDAELFYRSQEWYREKGVPWRRGYLFEGSPGTGKTSLVVAMAGHFKRPLYSINLGSMQSDQLLLEAFNSVPKYGLLLIEDIDATNITKKRGGDDTESKGATLSGLLNIIDGAISADGRLLVMTSNHPEHLDPALLRPGRVDMRLSLLPLYKSDVIRMYDRFIPDGNGGRFADELQLPITGAKLQELLMNRVRQ
jgi:hypothetical protein